MNKNLMPEVAKLLGVELGEEFLIENADRKETVVLAADGLHVIQPNNVVGPDHGKLLSKTLQGLYEVKKIPWEPKEGDSYYAMSFIDPAHPKITHYDWSGSVADYACLKEGLIYKTQAEAEAHMSEDYKRLTGKKLEG